MLSKMVFMPGEQETIMVSNKTHNNCHRKWNDAYDRAGDLLCERSRQQFVVFSNFSRILQPYYLLVNFVKNIGFRMNGMNV